MDGSYHITPVVPRTGSPAGPWSLDEMRAVRPLQWRTGRDGQCRVRGGAAVQLSSGLRIWSHWSLISTTHTASVSSVTALGRDYTIYC